MLQLNLLVIFYVLLTSGFIFFSKERQNKQRKPYLVVNCFIVFWESLPFFMPVDGVFLNFVYDWSPLVFLPIFHRETALLTAAFGWDSYDDAFIRFEEKWFPSVMRFHHQNQANHKILSEYLHLCYLSFFVLIYGVPLYFYMRGELLQFYMSTFSILFLICSCFMTHGFIPVHGPRNIFEKIKDHRSDGFIFRTVHKILADGSTAGTAFPSGHTGVACITILMTGYFHAPLFYVVLPIGVGLILSTVYGRFHYVIDVFFGMIYAFIAFFVTKLVYL